MKTGERLIAVVLLALLVRGFAPAASSQELSHPTESQAQLVEVPPPDLSHVDAVVRDQIQAAQDTLSSTLSGSGSSAAEKGEAFGRLGQLYQAYGFDDAALASYENAGKLNPQSFKWHYYAGYFEERKGNLDAALLAYQRAHSLRPKDGYIMSRMGNLEYSANHLDAAKSWFSKSITPQTRPPAALAGLGKVALEEHDYSSALKYFQEALAKDPQASSLHYQLAMTYRGLRDAAKMQEELQARGRVDPEIKDPLLDEIDLLKQGRVGILERATQAMSAGRFADAAAAYRQMIQLNPNDAIAYRYLGVALARSGKRVEALQQYEHSVQLDPNSAAAHYSIGILLIQSGKEEAAVPHFQESIRLDPGREATHFQLANLLMRQGKNVEAAQQYAAVVSLDPQNNFARLMQAMATIRGGDYAQGRSLLEEAAQAFPKDPDIANALARLLAAAPDPKVRDEKRALGIIGSLMQNQQGDPFEDGITLAMALAAVGRFEEAATYQAAIIHELESSRKLTLANQLRGNLDLYRQKKRCTKPWPPNDPIFKPVPGKMELLATH